MIMNSLRTEIDIFNFKSRIETKLGGISMDKKSSDELNTEQVLQAVQNFARDRQIEDIVVASTTGSTGVKATEIFDARETNLVVVGHSSGFREPNHDEFNEGARTTIEDRGGKVFIGPMIFHNLNAALGKEENYSPGNAVADTLRLFGQGTKVALECVLMAVDAGLVESGTPVVSVAGTSSGADTALLIHSSNSKRFYEARIRKTILKPSEAENL